MMSISALTILTTLFFMVPDSGDSSADVSTSTVTTAPAIGSESTDGPKWTGYADALTSAQKSGKKVLVDVYTDWCGWCKKMDKNVYADAKVRAYIDEHFVAVKLDAESKSAHDVKGESMTEKDIARRYGVRSFPTTLFLAADGEPITVVPGYIEASKFVLVLKYINEEHYKSTKWEEFLSNNG